MRFKNLLKKVPANTNRLRSEERILTTRGIKHTDASNQSYTRVDYLDIVVFVVGGKITYVSEKIAGAYVSQNNTVLRPLPDDKLPEGFTQYRAASLAYSMLTVVANEKYLPGSCFNSLAFLESEAKLPENERALSILDNMFTLQDQTEEIVRLHERQLEVLRKMGRAYAYEVYKQTQAATKTVVSDSEV